MKGINRKIGCRLTLHPGLKMYPNPMLITSTEVVWEVHKSVSNYTVYGVERIILSAVQHTISYDVNNYRR